MSGSQPIPATSLKLIRSLHRLPVSLRHSLLQQNSISSSVFRPSYNGLRYASTQSATANPTGTNPNEPLIPPPGETSGPLLSRMPNRALPDIKPGLSASTRLWLKTLPIFILICALGSLSIFNYQKSSSSTVSSILYALRTSPAVREMLGNEIYFASRIPWISGELNQLHGNINISFWVKGSKQRGIVKFVSVRRRRDSYFETLEWSLQTDDGRVLQLLETDGRDPMGDMKIPQNLEDAAGTVKL